MSKIIILTENQFKIFSLNENKWNGNGEEWELIKPKAIPANLYHVAPIEYRQQILKYGLLTNVGEEYQDWWNYEGPNGEEPDNEELPESIFLTSNPYTWYDNLDDKENYDIWAIDVKSIDEKRLFLDPDSSMRSKNSYCYLADIPPISLRLLEK